MPKKIQLFVINENQKFICYKKCKILINKITKQLIIIPSNKDVKVIVLSFDRTFIHQQNILGILGTVNDTCSYILILPNIKSCQIIFDATQNKKEGSADINETNMSKFLALLQLINVQSHEGLMKSYSKSENKPSSIVVESHNMDQTYQDAKILLTRKRKRHCSSSYFKIIQAQNFKIIKNQWIKSKLIIFSNSDQSQCYEYSWNKTTKLYNCIECRRLKRIISAKMCQNYNGKKFVKLLSKHVCEMQPYNPEKYNFEKRIFDSSNFQVFNYSQKGCPKSTLVLFCPSNKKLCYEYFWYTHKQNYACCRCDIHSRATAAIFKGEDGNDYLMLGKKEHVCDLREVNITKFKDDLMLQKPMYEIIEKSVCGVMKKFMLIFVDPTREYCYKLQYAAEKCFFCYRCRYRGVNIQAYVKTDKNGEECIYVKNEKHICTPIKYSNLIKDNIVAVSNFQLLKRKVNGKFVQHLIVFTNGAKTECFEYTWSESFKKYICNACRNLKGHVFARLCKTKEGAEFVELCQISHKCTPIKFIPEISIKYVFLPDFKVEEYTLDGFQRKRIRIFDATDKSLCYFYYKETRRDNYRCAGCCAKNKYVTAKMLQNSDGQPYLELSDAEHACEPQKCSVINTVRKPNFKLAESTIDGFKRKFVIIFDENDSNLCYKYCYFGTDKAYLCVNCRKMDVLVSARLKKDKDGEEYVSLNKNEHLCNPIKYNSGEFSTKILTSVNFELKITTKNGIEKKTLIVNSTTNKDKYYIYIYSAKNDVFFCKECNDKNVSAKLKKDGNGEDYLQMGFKKHARKCRALTKS